MTLITIENLIRIHVVVFVFFALAYYIGKDHCAGIAVTPAPAPIQEQE